ncbi:MAG: SIMPL domain-containing protein [Spirochaetaceae bacterium]
MRIREATILAAGAVAAALVLGLFFYATRGNSDTVQVVGTASTRFAADTLKWSLTLTRTVGGTSPAEGYSLIQEDVTRLRAALLDEGISGDEVSVQPATSHPMHDREGGISGYRVQQAVQIITGSLDAAEGLALAPGEFLESGMILERSQLEYFYSAIDSLKHDLLAEATRDAQERATRMAEAAGVGVGPIREARAGVFQIREPYSTEVTGYGVYNTDSRDKEITVTVHATFAAER